MDFPFLTLFYFFGSTFSQKVVFGSTFSQKVVFGSTFFKKVVFWLNLFSKGCFWLNLFQKGCFLAQPFSKRLFFGSTFSKRLFFKKVGVGCYKSTLRCNRGVAGRRQNNGGPTSKTPPHTGNMFLVDPY
jgi:hypothetical protein